MTQPNCDVSASPVPRATVGRAPQAPAATPTRPPGASVGAVDAPPSPGLAARPPLAGVGLALESASGSPAERLQVEDLGRMAYGRALALQEARHAAVAAGQADDALLLVEHDPVVTMGRNGRLEHLLWPPHALAAAGIAYHETGRGGDVTYHGPGQLVAYPIVRLRPGEQDVRRYVGQLEDIVIRVAADFGVVATRVPGLRGIWVGNDKLAAIGVRLARWTTLHGFALNVDVPPEAFCCIVPCGLHGRGVTSLERLLGRAPALWAVRRSVVRHTQDVLGRRSASVSTPVHDKDDGR